MNADLNNKGHHQKNVISASPVNIAGKLSSTQIILEDGLLFRLIFEHAAIGIALINLEGRLIEINPAFLKMFGYEPDELYTRSFQTLFHPDESLTGNCVYHGQAQDGSVDEQEQYSVEKRFVTKEGLIIWGRATVSLVRNPDLEPQFFIVMIEDITKRKQMAEELLKSQRFESMAMVAGGIAHDFNNILAGILANAQLAKVLLSGGQDISKNLGEIGEAIKRAAQLTKQLLNFAKCGTPVKKTTSIVELIKTTAEFSLRGSNVKCEYHFPARLWSVEADEGQLSQVINNLIVNAVQAMPEGGTITITAENLEVEAGTVLPLPQGKYVKLTLKDTGIGIPADFLPKIFEPYFTTKEKGNGLGLATTYSIIKKHDGYIEVESTPYMGTTFYIYLPALETGIAPKREQPEKIFTGKGKILLMDDEATVRHTTKKLLTYLGYKTVIAKDGSEALKLYTIAQKTGNPFDAVIMDLTVPGGGGGKETLIQLKKIDPKVKAILSSGYVNDLMLSDYRRYGFQGAVTKPYNMEELSATLHRVITGSGQTPVKSKSGR